MWYVEFSIDSKTFKILIVSSGWILTAYSGNGMRLQYWSVRTLSTVLKVVLPQPTDLPLISPKME